MARDDDTRETLDEIRSLCWRLKGQTVAAQDYLSRAMRSIDRMLEPGQRLAPESVEDKPVAAEEVSMDLKVYAQHKRMVAMLMRLQWSFADSQGRSGICPSCRGTVMHSADCELKSLLRELE